LGEGVEEGEGEEEEEEKEEEVVGKGLIFDKFVFSLETVGEGGMGAVSGEPPAPPVITELMEGREVSEDPPLWEDVPTRGGEKETVGEVL